MSNLRKCSTKACKKEINIKKDHYVLLHSILYGPDSKGKEYFCKECGKAFITSLGNGDNCMLNATRQYIHMGPDTNWIKGIKTNGLLSINLDSKIKEEETEIVTFSELIDNCKCSEEEKAKFREKYQAAKCSGL